MSAKNSIPVLGPVTHVGMLQMQLSEIAPLPSKKPELDLTDINRNERDAQGERDEILVQYALANSFMRMHLFLQFPDLRHFFQEIDRKDLTAQRASSNRKRRRGKRSWLDSLID